MVLGESTLESLTPNVNAPKIISMSIENTKALRTQLA
jgi:hypothetical protein